MCCVELRETSEPSETCEPSETGEYSDIIDNSNACDNSDTVTKGWLNNKKLPVVAHGNIRSFLVLELERMGKIQDE